MRAAEAAGYSMASPDDDLAQTSAAVPISAIVPQAVSVEDLARGSRPAMMSEQQSVAVAVAAGSMIPQSVRTGAHSVRETVYGYLGFGIPA